MNKELDLVDFKNLANSKNIRRIVALLNFTGTITLEQVSLIINFKIEKTDKILRRLHLFDIVWYRKIDNTFYASLSTKGYRFYKYLNNKENKKLTSLQELVWVRQYEYVNPKLKEKLDIIETALKDAERYKKAVEIIKTKGIDIIELRTHKKAKTYNEHTKLRYSEDYTDEEFDLLKELFKDD